MTHRTEPTAKKSLGQHWLKDPQYLNKIVDAAQLTKTETVLEIGPGLGTLTELLARQVKQVIAVEVDLQLAHDLEQSQAANVTITNADIRDINLTELAPGYKVVANIPYYLTGQIIRQLLETQNPPQLIVLLVQKEVAERLVAKPGKMSLLSVAAQFYTDVRSAAVVPAEAFSPPPKVDSQVVILEPKAPPKADTKDFFRMVRAGFGERRKKLANSLAGGLQLEKSVVASALAELQWDENIRAQELSVEDWLKLYERLKTIS